MQFAAERCQPLDPQMQVDPIGLQVDAFDQQFNDAGLLVISEAAVANRRVDFAIWSDALQPVMGNPLLVEVKGELRGTDALRKAAQQLSAVTSAAGTGWGLLLYGDALIADERLLLSVPPNVLVLSLSSLFEEMRGRPFAEIVKDLRNRRVHGVGRL